jgi:hypothetical protein
MHMTLTRSGMSVRIAPVLVAVLLVAAMAGPESSRAEHLDLDPKVEARVGESTGTGHRTKWQIIVEWNVNCLGGGTSFDWDVKLIDQATGSPYHVDGKVKSPTPFGSRTVNAPPPPLGARVYPQIRASCFDENLAQHSSPSRTGRGMTITIPGPVAVGGEDGTGGGSGGGGGGKPDPGPCANTKLGTGGDDLLTGTRVGDRLLGFGGDDRLRGLGGPDCLLGGKGQDRLVGGKGRDRLVGGKGKDPLVGGPGHDVIRARDGMRDQVRCGGGRDRAYVDGRDRVSRDCERVLRRK